MPRAGAASTSAPTSSPGSRSTATPGSASRTASAFPTAPSASTGRTSSRPWSARPAPMTTGRSAVPGSRTTSPTGWATTASCTRRAARSAATTPKATRSSSTARSRASSGTVTVMRSRSNRKPATRTASCPPSAAAWYGCRRADEPGGKRVESGLAEAIVLREHGGPERLRLETVEVGEPGPGQVRLRQTAVGVNFHDCYVRSGLYRTLPLPGIPGLEGAGVVEAIGPDVPDLRPGDRVAYFTARYGAYASERLIEADLLAPLPDAIDDRRAAAIMVKGLTAQLLVHRVHRIGPGDTVLVHAAAGGVGILLCQWARHLGATVIGTVGSA